jgi:hypothetical protein
MTFQYAKKAEIIRELTWAIGGEFLLEKKTIVLKMRF